MSIGQECLEFTEEQGWRWEKEEVKNLGIFISENDTIDCWEKQSGRSKVKICKKVGGAKKIEKAK